MDSGWGREAYQIKTHLEGLQKSVDTLVSVVRYWIGSVIVFTLISYVLLR